MKTIVVLTLVLTAPAGAFAQALNEATLKAEKVKADALQQQNKYKEAVAIRQRLVEAAVNLYGANSVEASNYLHDLGATHTAFGENAKAQPFYQRCVAIREAKLGKDSPETAQSMHFLAFTYQKLGDFAKAEELYKRSLAIREAKLGKDHPDVMVSLSYLGEIYNIQAQYAKAEPLFQRRLQIHEAKLGKDDEGVAYDLHCLANLYREMGQYAKAEPLYLRGQKIYETKLGPDDLKVAIIIGDLALLYQTTEGETKALPLLQRSLNIKEEKLGKEHREISVGLNNLAISYLNMGQYAKAEQLFQRSLKIIEDIRGKDHLDVAHCLNNLGWMYQVMGLYVKAEQSYLRSLQIREDKLGKDHPDVAGSLNNLASLYRVMFQYQKAIPLHERSLRILENSLGKDHPNVASALSNLAIAYDKTGQFDKAEALHLRSLKINEDKFGKEHSSVADGLGLLAEHYSDIGQEEKAAPLFLRALKTFEDKLGKEHPKVSHYLNNLVYSSERTGQTAQAAAHADRFRRIAKLHIVRVLPALSEKEQADFLNNVDRTTWHRVLSLGLCHPDDATVAERSAEWLLNGKGINQQTMAQSALLARDSGDTKLRPLIDGLREVRKELAQLTFNPPSETPQQQQQRQLRLNGLGIREQELAKQLSSSGTVADESWVELKRVRQALPADTVLVDIARFAVQDFKPKPGGDNWLPARYAAWIVPARGPIHLIDLGPADAIDSDVAKARQALKDSAKTIRLKGEAETETTLREPMGALAKKVLHPLLPHIGKAKNWMISPDGNLWLTPWAALPLPDGKYAVEDHVISYVISGRDLVDEAISKTQTSAPMILADPDFDLRPGKSPPQKTADSRGPSKTLKLGNIQRLPGTRAEAAAITAKLQQFAGAAPEVHTDGKASTGRFLDAVRPKVLVLSTHGYFLEEEAIDPKERDRQTRGSDPNGSAQLENPLLRCGLLLAGCNNADKVKEGGDNGVLTGLQIVGADLRGTELVVLSACETGLGDVRNGEGVAGLRQAFQLAGAKCVVATLWQVPDTESAQLMIGFFDQLADKQTKADALRNAQLSLIKARRDKTAAAHPYYWAAYTVTGK